MRYVVYRIITFMSDWLIILKEEFKNIITDIIKQPNLMLRLSSYIQKNLLQDRRQESRKNISKVDKEKTFWKAL